MSQPRFDYGERQYPNLEAKNLEARLEPSVCAVPGCNREIYLSAPWDLPLCDEHRICPRCGARVHVPGRLALPCCGLHTIHSRLQAWRIPWLQLLDEGWIRAMKLKDRKMRHARVLVGRGVEAASLPWPV